MRLLRVNISEFRSIADQELTAEGLVVLFGPNSAPWTAAAARGWRLRPPAARYARKPCSDLSGVRPEKCRVGAGSGGEVPDHPVAELGRAAGHRLLGARPLGMGEGRAACATPVLLGCGCVSGGAARTA